MQGARWGYGPVHGPMTHAGVARCFHDAATAAATPSTDAPTAVHGRGGGGGSWLRSSGGRCGGQNLDRLNEENSGEEVAHDVVVPATMIAVARAQLAVPVGSCSHAPQDKQSGLRSKAKLWLQAPTPPGPKPPIIPLVGGRSHAVALRSGHVCTKASLRSRPSLLAIKRRCLRVQPAPSFCMQALACQGHSFSEPGAGFQRSFKHVISPPLFKCKSDQ